MSTTAGETFQAETSAASATVAVPANASPPLTWRVRFAFAFGQLSEGVQSTAFGIFLLFFYNQVVGLSGQMTSLAMFVALMIDAFVDPFIGSWSDRAQTRWGRRHPFMYAAALPFGLSFYLLFTPPAGLSDMQLFFWLVGFAVLNRITLAVYSIPHTAMTAELSNDYDERTLLSSVRSLLGSVGTVLVMILGMSVFFSATPEYPNGQLNPEAYGLFAATFAAVLVFGIWVSALGTHDQIPRLRQAVATTKRFTVLQVVREAGQAFALPAFRTMVVTAILFGTTLGMVTALSLYLGNLYFGFTPEQLAISFPMTVLGSFIGAALATPLTRVFREKKTLLMAGLGWYAMWNTTPICMSLLGLFPAHGEQSAFMIVLVCNSVCGLGIGVLGVMMGSMVADITDQHEATHGVRQEGIYYAALAFAAKVVGGAGVLLSGLIVDAAGITRNANAGNTDPEALRILALCTGPGVLAMIAVTIFAASTYNISRARHAQILAQIGR